MFLGCDSGVNRLCCDQESVNSLEEGTVELMIGKVSRFFFGFFFQERSFGVLFWAGKIKQELMRCFGVATDFFLSVRSVKLSMFRWNVLGRVWKIQLFLVDPL